MIGSIVIVWQLETGCHLAVSRCQLILSLRRWKLHVRLLRLLDLDEVGFAQDLQFIDLRRLWRRRFVLLFLLFIHLITGVQQRCRAS